ncbi:uncharacterized protein PG986_007955 [Apiospora aurea]|uniref:TPR domain-containing protein n=1 Tax=Apiospora aurea TaxID=335848 RepID=A0ABR1QE20_9PEZI
MSAARLLSARGAQGLQRSQCARPLWTHRISLGCTPRPVASRLASTDHAAFTRLQQKRYQSSGSDKESKFQTKPEPPSLGTLFRALRQSFSFRPLLGAFRGQSLRRLFRQSPEELVIAVVLLAGIGAVVVYVIYTYFSYFQSEQFTRFPPAIAKTLRRALYYSNYAPDPKLALKYYKIALEQCEQHALDPFSDEVLGLKIQLAAWLEKIGSFQNSTEVLEALLRDCRRWVDKMEEAVKKGQVDKSGNLIGVPVPVRAPTEAGAPDADVPPENLWGKRTRVLGKCVGISVKLGELYADEHVLKGEQAGERLVWAVETVLKELQRRQAQGVHEGEGEWMPPEQIGGALEALANHYESKSQHYLAAPLYLQALTLSPPKSCHTAVLSKANPNNFINCLISMNANKMPVNNLAISLAQQPTDVPTGLQPTPATTAAAQSRPTRSMLLKNARQWALQAHATSTKVTGEDRTPECDEACAVALCNLGEIAAMTGDMEEAKKRFKESLGLSKRIAFPEGISQAQDGLAAASMQTKSDA